MLDKRFDFDQEKNIYENWERGGYFKPEINKGREEGTFCIIMPPPNANGNLHLGHALMATIEDIYIRYHRMTGKESLYLPGADHAGFETQIVYDKILEKEGKNRFDLSREELYNQIWDFTQKNKTSMESQLRALGASCDWDRRKFTLDEDIINTVYSVFKRMFDEGLIYRGKRVINWDPYHQTSFSELEVDHIERKTNLVYIKYPLKGKSGQFICVATTRPETMLGDTAVAVNPQDERYKKLIGQIAILPISGREIPIIADEAVDKDYGTGAVKVTPAHDPLDFEIGERHNLPIIEVIGRYAKMTSDAGTNFVGLKTKKAREKVMEILLEGGLIEKVEEITHNAAVCYKCGKDIEPIISEQWFVKTKDLARSAIKAVEEKKILFVTEKFEKIYLNWMTGLKDWNISRQIVWGIQIPAWYCACGEIIVTGGDIPKNCPKCHSNEIKKDVDTFDTWFSSAQWPYATLGYPNSADFSKFYPTNIMETGWDILPFWVSRMIMMGLYATEDVPFRKVYLHGLVRDKKGLKMSKSKGNVVNPMDIIEKYGTDALRLSLVMGTATGNEVNFSEEKVKGARNFITKLWNIARFIEMNIDQNFAPQVVSRETIEANFLDNWILGELEKLNRKISNHIANDNLNLAAEEIYDFTWNKLADWYIEGSKLYLSNEETRGQTQVVLKKIITDICLISHPFIPFVTQAIWQGLNLGEKPLIISEWPTSTADANKATDFESIQSIVREMRLTNDIEIYLASLSKNQKKLVASHKELLEHLAGRKI
jgi:valyl-tRNA synthetase